MKNTIVAAICAVALGLTSVAAMAQSGTDSSKMGGAMQKGDGGSQGMTKDSMSKDGMKKDAMHKDGAHKDGMKKDGMMKKN
ncbi:MAG: pentapeptide MXKDX repeat protein [Bradyrhizobiaceae bacterium]|nr:MAG: pentapeptide MXKDX repeat protein [Bradyrhizobiaceae bacterium]